MTHASMSSYQMTNSEIALKYKYLTMFMYIDHKTSGATKGHTRAGLKN